MKNEPSLYGEEIKDRVLKKFDEYKGLGQLKNYAMFMGKALLLEMALKSILQRKYDVPEVTMKK
jgi:hypothetical protein